MLPAGAIGMCKPQKGLKGLIGRLIRWKQGSPYSHAVKSLGDGRITHSTYPWSKIEDELEFRETHEITWWVPKRPYSFEDARVLRTYAEGTKGMIRYGLRKLFAWTLRGVPGSRGHDMVCTTYVALLALLVKGWNLSGQVKPEPWRVDIRELVSALELSGYYRRYSPSED